MRTLTVPALALALSLAAGCKADKRLWIESEPPGALVRLDHQLVGETPYSTEFVHYGTHRLVLELEGYETYSRDLEVPPPWYGRFPLDFFSEVLFPVGWKDHKVARIALVPTPERVEGDELERVRARAEAFRTAGEEPPKHLPPLTDEANTPLVAVPR